MSKKSNVNPDHYKTAGRDPQGHDVVQKVERQKLREEKAWLEQQAAGHEPARKGGEHNSSESAEDGNSVKDESSRGDRPTGNAKESRQRNSESESKEKRSVAEQEARVADARQDKKERGREEGNTAQGGNPERHASSKSGKKSSAQKAAGWRHESRHESAPAPASSKVPGASGKEGRQGWSAQEDEERQD